MRDVTETVANVSLITASILSKKMDEDLDCLVLDITCGSSAFMETYEAAHELATSLVETCKVTGLKCNGLILRMDYPIGDMIGNTCELMQSLDLMKKDN